MASVSSFLIIILILFTVLFCIGYCDKIYKTNYSKILQKCKIENENLEKMDCKNFKVFGYDKDDFLVGIEINSSDATKLSQWWKKNNELYHFNFTLNDFSVDSIFMYRIQKTIVDLIFKSNNNFYVASWDFAIRPENVSVKFLTNELTVDFLFVNNWLLIFSANEEFIILKKYSLENESFNSTAKRIFTISNTPISDIIVTEKNLTIKLKGQTFITFNIDEFQNIYGSLSDVEKASSFLIFDFSQKWIIVLLLIIIAVCIILLLFSIILMILFKCHKKPNRIQKNKKSLPSVLDIKNMNYDDNSTVSHLTKNKKAKPLNEKMFETKKQKVIPNGYHPDVSTVNEDNEYSSLVY